jgi:hypothetical protein
VHLVLLLHTAAAEALIITTQQLVYLEVPEAAEIINRIVLMVVLVYLAKEIMEVQQQVLFSFLVAVAALALLVVLVLIMPLVVLVELDCVQQLLAFEFFMLEAAAVDVVVVEMLPVTMAVLEVLVEVEKVVITAPHIQLEELKTPQELQTQAAAEAVAAHLFHQIMEVQAVQVS